MYKGSCQWRFLPSLLLLALVFSANGQTTQKEAPQAIDKKDTRVEPTSWGAVNGRVYDAVSGAPIGHAHVSVYTDEGFLETGRSVTDTNDLGGYRAQTILGRVSSNLDVGRALLSSGIGLLFGSATNTTKRIDVSRVAVRITAPGYIPFEGVVLARYQDAGAFTLDLEPVLLIPEGQPGVSVSATGWTAVRIQSVKAEPSVARKGEKVQLVAYVRAFGKNPAKNVEISASSSLWKGYRKMKLLPTTLAQNDLIPFGTEYTVTGKEKGDAFPVSFSITRSLLDYSLRPSREIALIQIVHESREDLSSLRSAAISSIRNHNVADALAKFKELTLSPQATSLDFSMLAFAAESASDYTLAADARRHLLNDKEGSYRQDLDDYAQDLYLGKNYPEVKRVVEAALANKPPKKWPEAVDAVAVGYLGLSEVKTGDLADATKLNESLLNWPTSGLSQTVIDFRANLRLAQVEAANSEHPNSASALADYGRALLDLGRYEEATAKLQQSLTLDPSQVAIRRDLTWAALQIQGRKPKTDDLSAAVAEARAALNVDNGKQRSKDFFSWNQYAILLYALAEQKRLAADASADVTRDEAIVALREALTLGRVGAQRSAGPFSYQYGYLSGSEVAISGFAYPQANASFVLLDSLKHLRRDPEDYLAQFNLASALLDLGQTDLAQASLDSLVKSHPDFVEARFLRALCFMKVGNDGEAQKTFEEVLAANPRHPRAHLLLADLFAKEGDVAGSAEQLAAHAQFYGESMPGR